MQKYWYDGFHAMHLTLCPSDRCTTCPTMFTSMTSVTSRTGSVGGGGGGRKGGDGGKVGATKVLAWPHQHRRRLLASLPVHAKLRLLDMTSKVTQVCEAGTAYGTMLSEDVCTVLQFVKPTLAKAAWTLLCTHVVQAASLLTAWQYP